MSGWVSWVSFHPYTLEIMWLRPWCYMQDRAQSACIQQCGFLFSHVKHMNTHTHTHNVFTLSESLGLVIQHVFRLIKSINFYCVIFITIKISCKVSTWFHYCHICTYTSYYKLHSCVLNNTYTVHCEVTLCHGLILSRLLLPLLPWFWYCSGFLKTK